MALPPLTEEGELPLGVHRASLREVRERFGVGSAKRKALALRLDRIYRIVRATGHLARFVVFGSFVTSKLESAVSEYSAEAIDGTRTRKRHVRSADDGRPLARAAAAGWWTKTASSGSS